MTVASLGVTLLSTATWSAVPSTVPPERPRIGMCERITAALVDLRTALVEDPFRSARAKFGEETHINNLAHDWSSASRDSARMDVPRFDIQDILGRSAPLLDAAIQDWTPQVLYLNSNFGTMGSVASYLPVVPEALREIVLRDVEAPFTETAVAVFDAFMDAARVKVWAEHIRREQLERMTADGLTAESALTSADLQEHYLDLVLTSHMVQHGFQARSGGVPFPVYTSTAGAFFKVLRDKQAFLDWSGNILLSGAVVGTDTNRMNSDQIAKLESLARHYARGHELAMAYAADQVPGFADLIAHVGKTHDREAIWAFMFDNVGSVTSPFYGGNWVRRLKTYFGIRY